uniref:Uncharacterized protein n=1 Tax=Glossina brevipalpis TaxID=37001 RepID=A0A1A9WMF5_9MUSC
MSAVNDMQSSIMNNIPNYLLIIVYCQETKSLVMNLNDYHLHYRTDDCHNNNDNSTPILFSLYSTVLYDFRHVRFLMCARWRFYLYAYVMCKFVCFSACLLLIVLVNHEQINAVRLNQCERNVRNTPTCTITLAHNKKVWQFLEKKALFL